MYTKPSEGVFQNLMDNKYEVPALDKAHRIVSLIASQPSRLKLIDMSRELGINKSSMFSHLQTMEKLGWVTRDLGDTYSLGSFFGRTGSIYFRQFDLVTHFHREASIKKNVVDETLQLGKLEGNQVFYLAKEEAPSPVRLVTEPGMSWPAYATSLGKVMLAAKSDAEVIALYPDDQLPMFTVNTLSTRNALLSELEMVRKQGFAVDVEEAVIGFSCVAAPVRGTRGEVIAAVSCSIPHHRWASKLELAKREIIALSQLLSHEG